MQSQPVDPQEVRQHAVFRALLQAMSRPGSVQLLPPAAPVLQLTCLLDCLFDQESGYSLAIPDIALDRWIRENTGARLVAVEAADFLLAPAGTSRGLLERLKRGTSEFPDQGASVIYQVESLTAGDITPLLAGPGIKESIRPSLKGLDPAELDSLRRINREFPLGVDAIFISPGGELLCIPRSTRIGGD